MDKTPKWAEPFIQSIESLLFWADQHSDRLRQLQERQESLAPEIKQEMELKLREYLGYFGQMLDDRELKSAPGIISITAKDGRKWNPRNYFRRSYLLTPFCECEQNIHPCHDGEVEFTKDKDWWINTAPWIARSTKVLAAGLQLAFAGMPLALGNDTFGLIKNDVTFMKELSKHIKLKETAKTTVEFLYEADNSDVEPQNLTREDMRGKGQEQRLMRTALSRFLEDVAPNNYRARQWGSLRRVHLSDNSYRWLCDECLKKVRS